MHRAALLLGVWEYLAHGLQHSHALVADDELHAVQTAAAEPLEEADPAGLDLLHSLGSSQNLTKTILIHGDCHQNGYIFVLSAPVAAQVDAVHIDIRIPSTLQGAVASVLDVDIGFLVQLADGSGRNLAAPQGLGDVLHTAHGNACQVHLDEGLLHAAADQFLDLPLDNFLIQLYNSLGHSLLSPFECLCGNFILLEPASYVFFYEVCNLRNLLYLII